jgi:deoxyribonuclease-4
MAQPAPLGAHVSTSGGVQQAPARAEVIGATAMQIFTKQASRWAEHLCSEEMTREFSGNLSSTGVAVVSAHDSYLINLASPDDLLRLRSLLSFMNELKRCESLGIPYLVSHPGNYMDDRASGLDRNAENIGIALECVPGNTMVLLETTAGSGTALGASFSELARLIEKVPTPLRKRVGVCVDTAHVFAAGYDLIGDFDGVWKALDDEIGWKRLRMMHLNDSKAALGSRRDRHELIGEGAIGEAPFRKIMTDGRFARIPKVIETPKLGDATVTDRRMLARLRGYCD